MAKRTGRPAGHTPAGPKIRQIRVGLGLTVMQVATQTGYDPESIRRAERGSGRISEVFASRLATALGVQPEDIATPPGMPGIGSGAETKIPA